jgi:hypothetical protein
LGESSSLDDIEDFFQKMLITQNDFILQKPQIRRGAHSSFNKEEVETLVMKHVRYHFIIENIIKKDPSVRVVGIVRDPRGVINSWLKTPREFSSEWSASEEWRTAPSKNQGRVEEYYGFEKWKEFSRLSIRLSNLYSNNFKLVQYEDLLADKIEQVGQIFDFCNINFGSQTRNFLIETNSIEVDDPDTSFRFADVSKRWNQELSREIAEEIAEDLKGTALEVFLRN